MAGEKYARASDFPRVGSRLVVCGSLLPSTFSTSVQEKKAKNWKFQMCFKKNSYLSISLEGLVHLVHSVLIELKKEDNKIKHISAWCLFSLNSYLLFTYLMWISLNDGYGNSKSCTLKWMFFCSIFFSKSFWNDVQFHFALHIST